MAPTGDAYFVDWIWSSNSNVHVANHRDWFTTYTPFASRLGSTVGAAEGLAVLGFGDVHLDVRTDRYRTGRGHTRAIVLKDVLFAPGCVCNLLGSPILDDYSVACGGGPDDNRLTELETGQTVGILGSGRTRKLWLKDHEEGSFGLGGCLHDIKATWSDSEMRRWKSWKEHQSGNAFREHDMGAAPYTAEEVTWLVNNWGCESDFLRAHLLDIYNEEDRADGRWILRAFMEDEQQENMDSEEDAHIEDDAASDSQDESVQDLERGPDSQLWIAVSRMLS